MIDSRGDNRNQQTQANVNGWGMKRSHAAQMIDIAAIMIKPPSAPLEKYSGLVVAVGVTFIRWPGDNRQPTASATRPAVKIDERLHRVGKQADRICDEMSCKQNQSGNRRVIDNQATRCACSMELGYSSAAHRSGAGHHMQQQRTAAYAAAASCFQPVSIPNRCPRHDFARARTMNSLPCCRASSVCPAGNRMHASRGPLTFYGHWI